MNFFKKIIDLLDRHERKRAVLLLWMILVMAILDVIGVASIMPFIAVLADPQVVETNTILADIYRATGFNNKQDFLFFLGVMVFLFLLVSLGFKALTTYMQLNFTLMREYSIGKRLIEGYLNQPYTWFLSRNSSDLGKNILSEVQMVARDGMMPLINLIVQSFVVIAMLVMLLLVDYALALTVIFVLGSVYGLILKLVNGYLSMIGSQRVEVNQERYKVIGEVFGAVKEVKVSGVEEVYVKRFEKPAKSYAKYLASAQVVSQLPRYALDAIAFGGMLLVILYLMGLDGGISTALPIIALYTFAGYRLMPALQQIYGSLSQLRFAAPALNALHADLMGLKKAELIDSDISEIKLEQEIQLSNIQFYYPDATQPTLKSLSLTIPAHSTIGLIGYTGSGKTTVVDIILGLLESQKGALRVDGKIINAQNFRSWQKVIGYVPQQIQLIDDTIAANIAFGIEHVKINQVTIEKVAKIANLHEFVVNELPHGYSTIVGDHGVRLSGGQRQRIGIARALYNNPKVLILDEATSALDGLTEKAVMDAVNNLGHEVTLIIIAHRLSTVRQCDKIYLLKAGEVIDQGSYDDLKVSSKIFQQMIGDVH
jgi:ATP-binding cassette, subfamily B, bacterial PglK